MKVTLEQIAGIAGVSRGTVDRALHNRSGVNPLVRERILTIAQDLGYTPNLAGKQLSARKRSLKLGVITPPRKPGFWGDVHEGIDAISEELADFGVTISCKTYEKYMGVEQLAAIQQLRSEGVSGLVIAPVNDPAVQKRLNDLIAAGIPVVIMNTEIEHVSPLCYIGADYLFNGRTAAGILHLIAGERHTELLILTGSQNMLSHTMRITGFLQELNRLNADCHLIKICKVYDQNEKSDDGLSYQKALDMLSRHPETTAVFTAAGSVGAVAKAIQDAGMSGRVTHLSFDLNEETIPALQDGSLTAVIGQESFKQGYHSIKVLFDYLVNGIEPSSKRIILQNEIFIQQNAFLTNNRSSERPWLV